jgi:hypothetical protein
MRQLFIAWLASSAAFSIAFVGFILLWVWLDDGTFRPWTSILRLGFLTISAALIVQLLYGGVVYFVLRRAGLWRFWSVATAYLLPLAMFGWFAIDTVREGLGMIAWVIFAIIVAYVSWLLAPVQARPKAA